MYDVFLSFSGEDTGQNFTRHLHEALDSEGVKTYIDKDLERGENISSALLKAIEASKMSLIIFSPNYASSSRCLDELVYIMDCREPLGQLVVPVFCGVDPYEVRSQTGAFGEEFLKVKERFKEDVRRTKRWSDSLTAAANLSGWDFSDHSRNDVELIDVVVRWIKKELRPLHTVPEEVESAASSYSTANTQSYKSKTMYDVFLSFRGVDTGHNFTRRLRKALGSERVETFVYNDLERGEDISPALLKTIEASRVSVIIFSPNYASSHWCLDELVQIMECKYSQGQLVFPVFYGVQPFEVRRQTGAFGEQFLQVKERFKEDLRRTKSWSDSLKAAADLSGWCSSNFSRNDVELIDEIVRAIKMKLRPVYTVPEEVESAGFKICADELAWIVEGKDVVNLSIHGGVEGIAVKLSTSIVNGISTSEDLLSRRRKIYGVNKYLESPARSFWVFVQEAFQDRILMILGVCAFLSLITGIAMGCSKNAYDGFEILASILLVVVVTATSDYKQYLQFQVFEKEKKNILVHATRNGFREKVSTYDLVPGDIVHLSIRDQVRADGLFVSGFSLLIDDSNLTAPSDPVQVNAANPFILSGMKVQDGSCKMLVTNVGMRTKWGKLIDATGEAGDDETPLQVKLNGVATVTGNIGLSFAVLTFFMLVGGLFWHNLQEGKHRVCYIEEAMAILQFFAVAVSIIVVAVPEGLPQSVNFSFAFSMKKMMNDKAMVRRLAACETMGSITAICTGKTGTLTTNHMTLVKICICGEIKEVDNSKSSLKLLSTTPDFALRILFESIFNNTGGEIVSDRNNKVEILGSPIEIALLELGLLLGGNMQEERGKSKIVKVEPFNNKKKRMAVVLELPEGGFRVHYKGASQVILGVCDKFINSNGEVVPLDEASFNCFMSTIEQFASEALQTICFAYLEIGSKFSADSTIPFKGYTLIGIMGIKNQLRPGVKESLAICQSAGIVVRMVTGDNITTAKAIARECGILTDKGIAIEGREFQEKSKEELLQLIPKIQVIAQCSPFDKHMLVKNLRKTFREVVAVTGGDINDVPTLQEANIGLVMGIGGTEVAKESVDAIIQDDNFSTIVTLAKWGRSIHINIQKLVQFQLTFIIVVLIVHLFLACSTGKAPLTPAQVLWVNLIADTSGGLALVSEPPEDDLMKRPPVCRTGNFINNVMWRNILGQSMYQFVMIWYLHSRGKGIFHLEGLDSDSVLNTLTFNSLVFCQVFNVMNCREIEKINVFRGMMNNYAFVGVIGCTVLFQIVIVQFICTSHLSLEQWAFTIFLGFLSMPIAAAVKMLPFF